MKVLCVILKDPAKGGRLKDLWSKILRFAQDDTC